MRQWREIDTYRLLWHQNEGGVVRYRLKGVPNPGWLEMKVAASDMAAVAAILAQAPVGVSDDGWLATGDERTG